ncbi:response regulator [Thermodesulfobacteriota bacterium]
MTDKDLLEGKKILIVDDEPDVLASLEELLTMCEVSKAGTFDEAKNLLETQTFDLAILDIMGVKGYELLDISNKKGVIAVMLTAHALTPDNIVKSYKEGAAYFVPKEEITRIAIFLNDLLKAKKKGESTWLNWLERLTDAYWERKFGPDWKSKDKEFWENFPYLDF